MAASRAILALMALGALANRPDSSMDMAVVSPTARADPAQQDHDGQSLLQADVVKVSPISTLESSGPYPAGWFGGFSQGESTYDYDGTLANRHENKQDAVVDGWNPQQKNPFADVAVNPKWFQESKSGGAKQAWQTFYPAEHSTMAGNHEETGRWFEGKGGVWQQSYLTSGALGEQGPNAEWFDESVNQLDGFGRQKVPGYGSPRNYLAWEEKTVNTTLTCKAPGCTANVSLLAPFNFNTEMYKNCRLSVYFHPTDFDDQYSSETVEWVQVNGRKVRTSCHPLASGCNKTAAQTLMPCVDSIPIDLLLKDTAANGDLKISAKIPDYVDECPHEGNMLSAVPMVTCLVSPKGPGGEGRAMAEMAPKPVELADMTSCITKMPLQCATKGCASEVAIPVNSSCAALGKCMLSIEVQQTDYDNLDGTSEIIEYIKVDGKEVKTKLNPGKNPCKTKYQGKPSLTEAEMKFTALSNHVLQIDNLNLKNGRIVVEGKISQFVDECASNGYLFDAMAVVTCSKTGQATAALLEASSARAAPVATAASATADESAPARFLQETASGSQRRKLRLKGNAK